MNDRSISFVHYKITDIFIYVYAYSYCSNVVKCIVEIVEKKKIYLIVERNISNNF